MTAQAKKPAAVFDGFTNAADVAREFEVGTGEKYGNNPAWKAPDDFPTDDEIIVAIYRQEDYEGDAVVLWERAGKLFEAHGSHCSCMGLEGQWQPEETPREALQLRLEQGGCGAVNTPVAREAIQAYLAATRSPAGAV